MYRPLAAIPRNGNLHEGAPYSLQIKVVRQSPEKSWRDEIEFPCSGETDLLSSPTTRGMDR
jgi:hypothetical protein